nr:MAG TPA: hypothetical protein [Caudoviricetes sp.]
MQMKSKYPGHYQGDRGITIPKSKWEMERRI